MIGGLPEAMAPVVVGGATCTCTPRPGVLLLSLAVPIIEPDGVIRIEVNLPRPGGAWAPV